MVKFRNNEANRLGQCGSITPAILAFCLLGASQCHCFSDGVTPSPSTATTTEEVFHSNGSDPGAIKESLCPEGSAYHNETSKCYKLLEKGPCGDLQLFYSVRNAPDYGDCGCVSNPEGCSPNVKDRASNRMVLQGPDRKNCYLAYTKGPCKSGEWYILNLETRKPECQKNPCCSFKKQLKLSSSSENPDIFSFLKTKIDHFTFSLNGTCYKTFTQAYCKEGHYAQFFGTNDPVPHCYPAKIGPPICLFGVGPQVGMPCEAGFKLVGDDCVQANVEFE